jgi:hypothetical protein
VGWCIALPDFWSLDNNLNNKAGQELKNYHYVNGKSGAQGSGD